MSVTCFCNCVSASQLAITECCYTVAHKDCLIKYVSKRGCCPYKDCAKSAKKGNVIACTFPKPEINSKNKAFLMIKKLGEVLVNRFKNVSQEDCEKIKILSGAFQDFAKNMPSINDGNDVNCYRETKFQWIIRFLNENKVSIIVLAVALIFVCLLFWQFGVWTSIILFIREAFVVLKAKAPELGVAALAIIKTFFQKKKIEL